MLEGGSQLPMWGGRNILQLLWPKCGGRLVGLFLQQKGVILRRSILQGLEQAVLYILVIHGWLDRAVLTNLNNYNIVHTIVLIKNLAFSPAQAFKLLFIRSRSCLLVKPPSSSLSTFSHFSLCTQGIWIFGLLNPLLCCFCNFLNGGTVYRRSPKPHYSLWLCLSLKFWSICSLLLRFRRLFSRCFLFFIQPHSFQWISLFCSLH